MGKKTLASVVTLAALASGMVPGVGAAPANAQQATGQAAQTASGGQSLDAAARAIEGAVRSAMSRAGQPGQPSLGQVGGVSSGATGGSGGGGAGGGGSGGGGGGGGGGGSGGCFAPETLVLMADGTSKPIKDIKVGDKVTSWDFGKSAMVMVTVKHVYTVQRDYHFVVDGVRVTAEHPYCAAPGQYTEVWLLKKGTPIAIVTDGDVKFVPVAEFAKVDEAGVFYNMTVSDTHTYIVSPAVEADDVPFGLSTTRAAAGVSPQQGQRGRQIGFQCKKVTPIMHWNRLATGGAMEKAFKFYDILAVLAPGSLFVFLVTIHFESIGEPLASKFELLSFSKFTIVSVIAGVIIDVMTDMILRRYVVFYSGIFAKLFGWFQEPLGNAQAFQDNISTIYRHEGNTSCITRNIKFSSPPIIGDAFLHGAYREDIKRVRELCHNIHLHFERTKHGIYEASVSTNAYSAFTINLSLIFFCFSVMALLLYPASEAGTLPCITIQTTYYKDMPLWIGVPYFILSVFFLTASAYYDSYRYSSLLQKYIIDKGYCDLPCGGKSP